MMQAGQVHPHAGTARYLNAAHHVRVHYTLNSFPDPLIDHRRRGSAVAPDILGHGLAGPLKNPMDLLSHCSHLVDRLAGHTSVGPVDDSNESVLMGLGQ